MDYKVVVIREYKTVTADFILQINKKIKSA